MSCFKTNIRIVVFLAIAAVTLFLVQQSYIVSENDVKIANHTIELEKTRILLWTPRNSAPNQTGFLEAVHKVCGTTCEFTMDRGTFNTSHGVLFFPFYLFHYNSTYPTRYSTNQTFIMYEREPPTRVGTHSLKDNFFNATSTFMMHSDIPYPYGYFQAKSQEIDRAEYYKKLLREIKQKKSKGVFKVFSRCITSSQREDVIAELQKYLDIDLYGKCGNRSCDEYCFKENSEKYRFYLSLENSICLDYVTEKFYRFNDLVPIVFKKEYYRNAPPRSFIAMDDFASLKSFANYIKFLLTNDEAYAEHLMWKYDYERRVVNTKDQFCKICQYVRTNKVVKTYTNITEFWNHRKTCDRNFTENLLKNNKAVLSR
ncbi:unnamed protein product [Bursaphelenchus xylophilus]|uniref:Fucosyltransferase n=1 Tax=Bursaphelenchus xylophilus TaxID=6326 RepID=A0A1I7RQD4_BURXY|nr:unnamed protein product [Bursaphelenchus xylophilus]CAG9104400.1 unnamed protein product [Bursaphelenchus xylophilus]